MDIVLIAISNIDSIFIFSARKIFPGWLGEAERGTWCTARTCTRRSYPVFVGHLTGRNSEPNGGNNFKDHSYQPSVHTRRSIISDINGGYVLGIQMLCEFVSVPMITLGTLKQFMAQCITKIKKI